MQISVDPYHVRQRTAWTRSLEEAMCGESQKMSFFSLSIFYCFCSQISVHQKKQHVTKRDQTNRSGTLCVVHKKDLFGTCANVLEKKLCHNILSDLSPLTIRFC